MFVWGQTPPPLMWGLIGPSEATLLHLSFNSTVWPSQSLDIFTTFVYLEYFLLEHKGLAGLSVSMDTVSSPQERVFVGTVFAVHRAPDPYVVCHISGPDECAMGSARQSVAGKRTTGLTW